jgi:hypothetical protein
MSKNSSLPKPTLRFRPQNVSKRAIMVERLKFKKTFSYNYQERHSYVRDLTINRIGISRRFGQLHYLACHAPTPVAKRWWAAYKSFQRKYLPTGGSMRYVNTWTAHSWL